MLKKAKTFIDKRTEALAEGLYPVLIGDKQDDLIRRSATYKITPLGRGLLQSSKKLKNRAELNKTEYALLEDAKARPIKRLLYSRTEPFFPRISDGWAMRHQKAIRSLKRKGLVTLIPKRQTFHGEKKGKVYHTRIGGSTVLSRQPLGRRR